MIGPEITVTKSCFQCECCKSESYVVQSDSGSIVYCAHPSIERTRIGDSSWKTPAWCPAEYKGSNDVIQGPLRGPAGMEGWAMIEKIERYLRQLAPHQKEREAARLLTDAVRELHHRQWKIDSLMLEYCPDEMAKDQMENLAKHQKAMPNAEIRGQTGFIG